MKVVVVCGGRSSEREVSLKSGRACADAVSRLGYDCELVDFRSSDDLLCRLMKDRPDVAFNALHGVEGEDGCIQGVLNLLRIPYTHSGVTASAVAMDKSLAKIVFDAAGLRTPAGGIYTLEDLKREGSLHQPFVAKPNSEGSSQGVLIVGLDEDFVLDEDSWPFEGAVLVEEFIPGQELTVAVLDGEAFGVTELITGSGFYDFEAKYTEGLTRHIVPANIPDRVYQAAMHQAEIAHRVIGCRSLTRSDFRYDPSKADDDWAGLYLLEINTQPGMTELSLAPEQAAHGGVPFDELVDRLLKLARYD